ncbi:MAG: HupE/UreJ family protein [Acidobacteriota bacterium]|nr:HupE/UreJ family protein [Acidobacteriota bacterium]MDE2963976.1 HupE/UreJ family protein [Acidobacteriota bacterium]
MLDAWINSLSTPHSSLSTIRWALRFGMGAAVILMAAHPSRAHTTGVSYSDIRVEEKTAQLRLRINLRDLDFVDQLDLDRDRLISREEVSRALPRHLPRLVDNYRIRSGEEEGRAELVYWRQGPGPGELECLLNYRFGGAVERLNFTVTLPSLTDSGHWNLARVRHPGGQADLNFNLENPTASLEVGRGWRLQAGRLVRGLALGARQAATAPVPIGFLLGLLLTVPGPGGAVRVAGAFLAAQGLMALLATLGPIRLPETFLASATALSLAYIAAENLLVKETANRWAIGGCFGLLFGADLSSGLLARASQASAPGYLGWGLGLSCVLALAAALIFLLNRACRRLSWHPWCVRLVSVLLLGAGLAGFFRRVL